MSGIFDSHSHYNDKAFADDYNETLQRLKDNSVELVINVGYNLPASKLALEQARNCDFMYCAVGIHPEDAQEILQDGILDEYEKLCADPKVVAIGEGGLDYHYDDGQPAEVQKKAFIRQIELANRLGLPMIIHTRDAMQDTLEILTQHPLNKGVVHCYSGSAESVKQIVKMGLYVGFTGVITFKNARRAIESMKNVPLDKLLIETDCPYMAPEPNRGKRCDSAMLNFTAAKMGEVLGMSKEEVIDMTNRNARTLFGIK